MQKLSVRSLALGVAFLFALTLVPAVAFAREDGSESSDDKTTTTSATENEPENETENEAGDDSPTSLRQRLEELKSNRQENKQNRLDAAKLKACETRKTKISAIMARSVTRAEKQIALFDTITTRVKAFYAEKDKTLANYNELVAAVDAAKANAQTNLDTLKNLDAFDCSADDPKGNAEQFKAALKSVNQNLKDYRTAVKNLIVGVKSVQSTEATDQGGSEQ